MSFRGDDQRRYGQVPPVQYPVAGRPQDPAGVGRRLSFNTGDDGAYGRQGAPTSGQGQRGPAFSQRTAPSAGDDELFITSPGSTSSYNSGRPVSGSSTGALSGYGHQYQDPGAPPTPSHSSYNPQSFAPSSGFQRSQSTALPYHPHPASSRYSGNAASSTYSTSPSTAYTPQAYNPAAYASATVPQRQPTYHGYTGEHAYGAGAGTQGSPTYGQSPTSAYPAAAYSQPLHSPGRSSGYQQALPTSPSSFAVSSIQAQNSLYNPSHYSSGQHQSYGSNGSSPNPIPYASTPGTQAPYPTTSQIPVGPHYSTNDGNAYYNRPGRSDSQSSSRASPYTQPLASPGLQRHPTNAPLPNRPMADLPEEETPWDANGRPLRQDSYDDDEEHYTQDSIMQEIEAELGGSGGRPRPRPAPINGQLSDEQTEQLRGLNSNVTTPAYPTNHMSQNRAEHYPDFDDDDDDDPEGTAGVLAMQQAELDDQRFGGNTYTYADMPLMPAMPSPGPAPNTLYTHSGDQPPDSDSDFGGMMDLGMFSGGYAGNMTYGSDTGPLVGSSSAQDGTRPLPTPGYNQSSYESYNHTPAYNNAEVDYGNTGGLQPAREKRLSFDDGEERVSLHSRQSGTESPTKDDYEDLFYHPGLSNRPLPALPQGAGSETSSLVSGQTSSRIQHTHSHSTDSRHYYPPENPEQFYSGTAPISLQPERSISLSGHSNTPQILAPTRSRTDAADERKKMSRQQQLIIQQGSPLITEYDSGAGAGDFDNITLPSGRKRKFVPSKLTSADFRRCPEPWALSGIEAWVREMAEGELDLRKKTVEDAVTILFTVKVPTMNVADAEALSNAAVTLMLKSNVLIPEEEWVTFGDGHISGVLWQLTGSGCYAPKLHDQEDWGRCYSFHCTRTLKKVDLEGLPEDSKPADDWHIFYKLSKADLESRSKKEVERQNILHEIVTGEESYIKQLDIFRTLYRDDLRTRNPPIIHPDKREKFLAAVFGKLDTVLRINKDHLLAQLKYRQQEQGPWIVGFSDLFREWIRKAKTNYIEYATGYPRAAYMVRKESDRNILFKKFLEDKQKHKSSSKQDWTHFLITPLQRLQRYILLLETVDRKMPEEGEEKANLHKAIEEIRAVTHECDAKVAETNKRVEMMELDRMLVLRPGFQSKLNLDHLGRTLIIQGELQRLSSKGMKWVDSHALLFDHYLILAKMVMSRDGRGDKKYDVSREPIPMPLLFLESMNDEPVIKQKGITAPLGRTAAAPTGAQLSKVVSNGSGRPGLEHTSTGTSIHSVTTLVPTQTNDAEGKILYPFKVKHLGHEVYTLYASSSRDRQDWCSKIIEAKTRHAKALFSQNAEPFRLRVLADAAFSYEASSPHARSAGVPVKGTPLDRAIQELEEVLGSGHGIAPVCRAQVNCATGFSAFGKAIIAVGTDFGVFIADPSNPRVWTRTVQSARITQIAVLEEFSICLVIADKALISYPLDVVAPVSEYAPPTNDSPRKAPQRLAKDVTYFATARMKDRTLLFYKRKEGLHTTFKVLEPILHKSTEKKTRMFGSRRTAGSTESFRDFDEFFFPIECFSLSLFQTYIAVSTAKGIEMLTLDKKQPMSIPDLKAPAIANIASRIRDQRPLGMFRLNENEFILTYEDCAVYVDKHGEVSRTLIMEYTGKQKKARGATMYGQYLLLFNEDYVEVRNAENGRLRQIIAGRDVRVIDYGIRGPTGDNAAQSNSNYGHNGQSAMAGDTSKGTVKIAMSHPELPGKQIILEMLLNNGHSEKS